jgi:hypothetical protein
VNDPLAIVNTLMIGSGGAVGAGYALWKRFGPKPEPNGHGSGGNGKSNLPCGEHGVVCEQLKILPEIRASLNKTNEKIDGFLDEVWGVIRRHERSIGRLEGAAAAKADDDTKGVI